MASPYSSDTETPRETTPVPVPVPHPTRTGWRRVWRSNDSHLVALTAFLTGGVLVASLAMAISNPKTPQCWLYLSMLSLFHFLEYFITAKYKPQEVCLDCIRIWIILELIIAFLYNNGLAYLLAQTFGVLEFLVEWYFLPHTKVISATTYAGSFLPRT